jgi:hypothetical protein
MSDLGAARDTYDPMPSPALAYANTGQAIATPARSASADTGDAHDGASNDQHAGKKKARDNPRPSRAGNSGTGRQHRAESNLGQPRGDGNFQRKGDRHAPVAGKPGSSSD